MKAQNALLAHHQATEKLPGLEQQAESPEDVDTAIDDAGTSTVTVQIQRMDVICMSTTALSDLQSSLAPHADPTKRQQVVLQRFAYGTTAAIAAVDYCGSKSSRSF